MGAGELNNIPSPLAGEGEGGGAQRENVGQNNLHRAPGEALHAENKS
jgi:hypothetical protein